MRSLLRDSASVRTSHPPPGPPPRDQHTTRRLLPALLLTAALVGLGRCEDLDDDDERSPSSGPRSVGHAPFLITGSGRSWLSKTAAKLERFAVPVGKQRILSEGGVVSWPYAHYRDRGLPVELESNSQDSRALRLAPGFRFSPVLHQVRHPLGEIRVRASPFPTLFCARVTRAHTHTGFPRPTPLPRT